jgi:HEAT repeat protein
MTNDELRMTNKKTTGAMRILFQASGLMMVIVFFASGCRVQKEADGSLKFKSLDFSVTELITMALDPDDADKRRAGISGLSQHPWGLKETVQVTGDKGKPKTVEVLKVYHLVASNPHEDPTVRAVAVNALGRAGNAKYLSTVLACLEEESTPLRWDAAVALDRVIGPQAVKPLMDHALRDPSMDVRTACAKALRHYQQQAVLETLCQVLVDREFSVRFQAHAALVELTGKDAQYDVDDWRSAITHLPLATQPR